MEPVGVFDPAQGMPAAYEGLDGGEVPPGHLLRQRSGPNFDLFSYRGSENFMRVYATDVNERRGDGGWYKTSRSSRPHRGGPRATGS